MKIGNPLRAALAPLIAVWVALPGCTPRTTARPEPSAKTATAAPSGKKTRSVGASKRTGTRFQAQGMVAEITRAPKPGSVPYKDALVAVHLTNVRSKQKGLPTEIVAYLWGMKDNQPAAASRIRKGQVLSLSLEPWDEAEDRYGGYNRVELSDPKTLSLEPYWAELD